jgi:peptidoglycan/LPS O-acetylase OafA/YrhL
MGVHSGVPGSRLGWLGVDLFFILSGFLITTLLLREYKKNGRISLPKFWARRFLRLMPAYWLYIGTMTVLMFSMPETLQTHGGWTPGLFMASMWGYFVNYAPAGGIWEGHGMLSQHLTVHLWSLAVEEQFYFLWPVLVALLVGSRRFILVALALLAVTVINWFFFIPITADAEPKLLYNRGMGILLGCTTALLFRDGTPAVLRSMIASSGFRIGLAVFTAVLYCAATYWVLRYDDFPADMVFVPLFIPLFAALVAMLWHGPPDALARFLAWRPLAYIGQISYGVYLYHLVAQVLVWELLLKDIEHWNRFPKFGLRLIAYFILTILISSASYYLLEKPFLALKERMR